MSTPFATPFNWRPSGPTKVISGANSYTPPSGFYAFINAKCWDGSSITLNRLENGVRVTGTWLKSERSSLNIFIPVAREGNYSRISYQVPENRYFDGFIFNTAPNYSLYFHFERITGTSNLNNTSNYNFIIRDTTLNNAASDEIREDASRVSLKLGAGQVLYLLANANTGTNSVHTTLAKEMAIVGIEGCLPGSDAADGWTFIDENTTIYGQDYRGTRAASAKWTASVVEYRAQS